MGTFIAKLPVIILKEGKTYVAYTPALDYCTHGNSLKDVQKAFAKGVKIFISELDKMGTLKDVLLESSISISIGV